MRLENKIKTKIKTSKERLEQLGWDESICDDSICGFVKEIDDVQLCLCFERDTYELRHAIITRNGISVVLTACQMLLVIGQIKELEVESGEK